MRIYLHELSEEPTHLTFNESEKWVLDTVKSAEESDESKLKQAFDLIYDLHKSHDLVFLKSKIKLTLGLLCSRCVKHIDYSLSGEYQCLYTRNAEMSSTEAHSHGIAYSSPTGQTGDDLDIQQLENDYFDLKDVLKEQINLQIPFQPLCKQDCKGICAVCGQDQNLNPCQCYRLKNTALANALKNIKLKN